MGYDGKYGKVTTEHGNIPDDEPVIVFRGRDILLPAVLANYAEMCESERSPEGHVELVRETAQRITCWQQENWSRVKVPDSARFFAGWPDEQR